MSVKEYKASRGSQGRQKLTAAGGVLSAIAASSCCVLPLALFSLGVSGAWIGNLTALAPYHPYFLAAAAGFLAYGYWLVYRTSKRVCANEAPCVRSLPNRLVIAGLVIGTVLVLAAIAFDIFAPRLLN